MSLTLPCVAGPYTPINCTLTLLRSSVRIRRASVGGSYPEHEPARTTTRFVAQLWRRSRSIATSSGQNDAGLFELNFRDERYLPFEGAGAICRGASSCRTTPTRSTSTPSPTS